VPVVEAFREYIQENPLVQMYLQAGLDAIPETVQQFHEDGYRAAPTKPRPGVCYGYSWEQLLDSFASICQTPPRFEDADIIGVPFLSLLIDLLNTEHGRSFFSIPEVNAYLKVIFDSYGEMLDSPASLLHMNGEEDGWLSPAALKRVNYADFVCDPSAPNYGFRSWHDWFTREIREEARPFSNDENEIINNSESFPFAPPSSNVQWKDKFWLKDQRYSLAEMFNADALPKA
jgi:phosphatidylserine decarboxylase